MIFLKWYSKQTAEPLGTIYRKVTIEHFTKWKKEVLIEVYKQGKIGIKQMANLGGMTFNECMLLLEQEKIEPPYNKILDMHSENIVKEEYEKKRDR
ncbi:MAG: hypothetical protein ACTSW1_17320 [Candidatus Hodarchaeales archaeon]